MRILALATGCLISVALVTGCGGGESSSSTAAATVTTSSLSNAKFIKLADAACTKRRDQARAEFIAYGEQVSKPNESAAEQKTHLTVVGEKIVVPAWRHEIDDITALGAPAGKTDEVEAMLQAIEAGIKQAQAQPERVLEASSKFLAPAAKLARGLGLEVCGNG